METEYDAHQYSTPRSRLAQRVAQKKSHLDALHPLSSQMIHELNTHLRMLLTYHSNAIEGNTLPKITPWQ